MLDAAGTRAAYLLDRPEPRGVVREEAENVYVPIAPSAQAAPAGPIRKLSGSGLRTQAVGILRKWARHDTSRSLLHGTIAVAGTEGSMNVSKEGRVWPASAWQLEFVRLIAFPATPAVFIDQQWWQELTSQYREQSEDFVSTRKKHYRDDRGTVQGVLLALTVDLRQVVWEARSPDTVDESGNFPTMGPYREKVDWFVELLGPWLTNSCPPLVRLAFSAKLLQPAASAKEAYRVLADRLPSVKLESNPDDFLLQINRRKESDVVDGLPINRLSTWSKMNVAIVIEPGRPFKWPDRCYSALELDINTAPERTEVLPSESLPRLFRELACLGTDIAEHGDIPRCLP